MNNIKFSTGRPPYNLVQKCHDAFDVDWDKGLIVTYGDTVYCQMSPLPPDLMEHEATHVHQQALYGVNAWWDRYLIDPAFRLSQEVEAYRNQLAYAKKNYNRQNRKSLKKFIIKCMVNMYGDMCTEAEAEKLLA